MALLAPVFFIPAVLALMQGQPSILMLLLLAIAFRQLAGGKLARAGLTLACLTIKPQFVLPMLLALVCWRKWRTLAAFACTGAVLIAISAAIVGWHATLHYPAAVMEFNRLESSLGGEHPASMPNLRGFTYVLVGTRISGVWLERTTIVLSILLLLMMVVSLKRFPTVSEASYSLVIVVTLLVSYHAYLHDTSLLLVPFLLMAKPMGQLPCSATHCSMAGVIVSLYAVPLLPTSLSTTALQMFAVVLMLAAILCLEVKGSDRRSTPSLRNAGLASTRA